MRTAPAFWWHETPTATARALKPVAAIWGAVAAHRMAASGTRLPIPVVCAGNVVTGGAGKTPLALALARILAGRGHRPAFVSRGYGRLRPSAAVLRVEPGRHSADDAGDEPLLLAGLAPTYVSSDRVAAGRHAVAEGATVLVLDDGLQNPHLCKSLSIAVVDAATGIGNGLCLPAGPLRAPMRIQWPAIAGLCLVGDGPAGERFVAEAAARGCLVLRGGLAPSTETVEMLRGVPLLAFAGIGRPAKFFTTLRRAGLDVRDTRSFPDHHRYTGDDRRALSRQAASRGLRLVTTAKDAVRLPADFAAATLTVDLVFEDLRALLRLLDRLDPTAAVRSP